MGSIKNHSILEWSRMWFTFKCWSLYSPAWANASFICSFANVTCHFIYSYSTFVGGLWLHCNLCTTMDVILLHKMFSHQGRDKMAAILQMTVSDTFSCLKIVIYYLKFHWNFFLNVHLMITQQWFRLWLGTEQVTGHYYLNQWWSDLPMHVFLLHLQCCEISFCHVAEVSDRCLIDGDPMVFAIWDLWLTFQPSLCLLMA